MYKVDAKSSIQRGDEWINWAQCSKNSIADKF